MKNIFHNYIPYNYIKEFTLLSRGDIELYQLKDADLNCDYDYWLKDTVVGAEERNYCVHSFVNGTTETAISPSYYERAVRPLLKFNYPADVGTTVICFGYEFTVIANDVAFCDNILGYSLAFDKIGNSDYDNSYIKRWIDLQCRAEMEKNKYYLYVEKNNYGWISSYSSKEALLNSSDLKEDFTGVCVYNAFTGQIIYVK